MGTKSLFLSFQNSFSASYWDTWAALWDPFSLQVVLMKHIFLTGIHSMQGWTATERHGVTRIRSTKRLKHREISLERTAVNKCLLILLDLKPYPKTRTTDPSDGFLHLRETSLDRRWEIEHFRLFFVLLVAGLVDLFWESLNFLNAPNAVKEM